MNPACIWLVDNETRLPCDILTTTRAYTLTGLSPYAFYTVSLTARDSSNAILAQSNSLTLMTTDRHLYLPLVTKAAP